MDFMTEETLVHLWRRQTDIMMAERTFWTAADAALDEGLASYEDVAVIYGCHPSTARKRVREARELTRAQREQTRRGIARGHAELLEDAWETRVRD